MWCLRICTRRRCANMNSGFSRRGRGPYERSGGQGREGDRRPSGLSGKEIGMYYKDRSQAKKKEKEKNERPVVTISREMQSNITELLQDLTGSKNNNHKEVTASSHSQALGIDMDETNTLLSLSPNPMSMLPPDILNNDPNEKLKAELIEKQGQPLYDKMQVFRHRLPCWHMREDILKSITDNQVTVISGETGCGKTTQISQFVLDHCILNGYGSKCNIICSQPRRISAITVAERVAAERGEVVGNSVGYQIRLEGSLPRNYGSITYCTTGVIIRRMIGDPLLKQCSHIFLDEVHERNNISDFLSIIVKDVLPQRPDLKVILMSATINADLFSNYFGNAPVISIPGRVFPVREFYLEDTLQLTRFAPSMQKETRQVPVWIQRKKAAEKQKMLEEKQQEMDRYITSLENESKYSSFVTETLKRMDLEEFDLSLILHLLKHICTKMEDGAILVFLPGWDSITKLHDMLQADVMFRHSSNYLIIPLHSLMPTASQKQVFERPPLGVRKIIIATNIAETSITIDDVVFVVDCGKVKETTYDIHNQLACLQAVWISKAAAKQRRGRAGRVQAGYCFHLFTKLQHENMADFQTPEMLRTPLEELILQIKILKLGLAEQFLEKAIESPPRKSIHNAITLLKDLQALTSTEELTPLGYHLANLPVHPRIGRIILFGAMFSCLNPVLTIASTLGFKEPFVIPLHKQIQADKVKLNFAQNYESDHIALLRAFEGWEKLRYTDRGRQYCWDHFLSFNTLEMLASMKNQFAGLLNDIGFISNSNTKDPMANVNSDNMKLVKAVLCAGLYPNVAKIEPGKREARLYTQTDGKVKLHPKSVNTDKPCFSSNFLIYHTKIKSSAIFLHDSTVIAPFPLLFFGGDISVERDGEQETVAVDKWIKFQAPGYLAQMFKDIRKELDLVLEQKIAQPNMNLYCPLDKTPSPSSKLIETIIKLITFEDYSNQKDRLAQGKHLYYRK